MCGTSEVRSEESNMGSEVSEVGCLESVRKESIATAESLSFQHAGISRDLGWRLLIRHV